MELNNGVLVSKIAPEDIVKGLITIVQDILLPEFKVADIYNADKRREYINSKNDDALPNLTHEVDDPWCLSTQKEFSEKSKKSKKQATSKVSRSSISGRSVRRTLIPNTFNLNIGEEEAKIKKIFSELKTIPVSTCPNATSILFRVFLELSVDIYLDRYGLVKKGALSACSSKEDLNGKLHSVLNHMVNAINAIDTTLSKGIKTELCDRNSILSIESLNAYVHNHFFYPKADNLIIGWDNTSIFFSIIWDCINKSNK